MKPLTDMLDYNPETGVIVRKVSVSHNAKAGDTFGSVGVAGYLIGGLCGKNYRAHRVAWALHYGDWPSGEIDHINGIKTDNRICNLRRADHSLNMQNLKKAQRNNKTGFLGVFKREGKFKAVISLNRKNIHLGLFNTAERAHAAYLKAKRVLHDGCTI